MIQTTFLYYLIQIAHYQSLSIAAEALHVSQPALSKGVKVLEEQVGAKLLERTYKGVTLTSEGKEVVELAQKAFIYLDEIETLYRQPEPEAENDSIDDLIIYCNPAYSSLVMSALSSQNRKSEDGVIQLFDITPEMNSQQLLLHNSNTVILGIVSDAHDLSDVPLSSKVLRSSKSYIACSKDFPYIAKNKTSISFKELLHVPLVISTNALEFQKDLLSRIQQYGKPNIKVLAPNYHTVSSATLNGVAASFSNKFYTSHDNDELRLIPIRNAPQVHLSLVYHRQMDSKKIERLAELLKPYLI